jgi:hypothetical protein
VQEKESLRPDYGLITHWQVEIDAFHMLWDTHFTRLTKVLLCTTLH